MTNAPLSFGGRAARIALGAAVAFAAALGLAPPPDGAAQSLKEMRARDAEERALQREADFTGRVCGASITASFDWSTFDDWPEGASATSACDGALAALEALCRDGRGAGGAVSSFVCAGDGAGASLSGGELTYSASPGDNGFDDAMAVLESNF